MSAVLISLKQIGLMMPLVIIFKDYLIFVYLLKTSLFGFENLPDLIFGNKCFTASLGATAVMTKNLGTKLYLKKKRPYS